MSEIYNRLYYENYDVGVGKVDYRDSKYTKGNLERVAKRIVEDWHPKTVLDAGCAMGHLVAAMRDMGVEAYGIDISEYAIEQVREDIRPYCAAQSLDQPFPEHFPKHFDLIFSAEVLEHIYEENIDSVIENIGTSADVFLFCSTPDDLEDPTHVNVRQPEYWAKLMAKHGMYHRVDYDASFLTPYAMAFVHQDNIPRLVEDYERRLRLCDWEKQKLTATFEREKGVWQEAEATSKAKLEQLQTELNATIEQQRDRLADYASQITQFKRDHAIAERTRKQAQKLSHEVERLRAIEKAYHATRTSFAWKLTKPLRVLMDFMKKILHKGKTAFRLFGKGVKSLVRDGFKVTWHRVRHRTNSLYQFQKFMQQDQIDETQLEQQRTVVFDRDITISIVVPLYNTPERFLSELIESVQAQTYSKWQLCFADGSDAEHGKVGSVVASYQENDARILYQKLSGNLGIAGNSNAALSMATGEYIALLDHDDILPPNALFECMVAITEQDADFVYTDEMVFQGTIDHPTFIHLKPDFSIDMLRSQNYICHLSVFSAELQRKVGDFSEQHNGSQDYDLILRLTEQAKRIVHIPKILYYWRNHEGSVASDVSVKPYCMESAKRAISDHLERMHLKGEVVDSKILSTYKVNYKIEGDPLVSILIPSKDHVDDLEICVSSILERSEYYHYEIIIIENNSEELQTFDYYEGLKKRDSRIRVIYWDGPFNYSAINNFGASEAKGEYLLLLNNDVEVITPRWIQEMLMFAQRKDVGAVGAMLYYPDDTIQHAGVVIGLGGGAGHSHKGFPRGSSGYVHRLTIAQNYSACTAACLMVSRDAWNAVQGLDEKFAVAFNDVDFCLRLREAGYLIVFTPYAELYHYESKSRGYEETVEKRARFGREKQLLQSRWRNLMLEGDPYYNPNLTLDREDFSLNIRPD